MDRLRSGVAAPADAIEVHQAAHVVAGHVFRVALGELVAAVLAHARRKIGLGDREGAAEAAAFVTAFGDHQTQAVDFLQQGLGGGELLRLAPLARRAQAQLAQAVATLMQGDISRGFPVDLGFLAVGAY